MWNKDFWQKKQHGRRFEAGEGSRIGTEGSERVRKGEAKGEPKADLAWPCGAC